MAEEPTVGACRLTGAPRAAIDPRKLTNYALDPAHGRGSDKARVFASVLGFDLSNQKQPIEQMRHGVMNYRAVPGRIDRFGARYTVDIPVTGPRGRARAIVRTAWIYEPGPLTPRLTRLYVR